jgi:hypothetical protein
MRSTLRPEADIRNSLEILSNLAYLTKHGTIDAAKVTFYMEMADEELKRLVRIAFGPDLDSTFH